MEIQKIPINLIKEADTRLSLNYNPENLIESIKKFGIINPVKLTTNGKEGFLLFSGFRRFSIGKNFLNDIPAIVFEESLSPCEMILLNVKENLAVRKLSLYEKINIIRKAEIFQCDLRKHSFIKSILNNEKLKNIAKRDYPEIINIYLDTGELDKKSALSLRFFNNKELEFVSKTFVNIHFTRSEKQILIDLLLRIKEKEKEIKNFLEKENKKEILESLKKEVFPFTAKLENKFQTLNKQIKMGKLKHSPFFESPQLILEIVFEDFSELKKKIETIRKKLINLSGKWYED